MSTSINLNTLFSEPPFSPEKAEPSPVLENANLQTPSKIDRVTKLRKRHLSAISDSPFKKTHMTKYGSCFFSQKVVEYKKEQNITSGRNVAIAIFQCKKTREMKYTIAATTGRPGGAHAELLAYDKVPAEDKENIEVIYTERQPCQSGSNCHKKLKLALPETVEVVYSTEFPKERARRNILMNEFKEVQHEYGVRNPKKISPKANPL